MRPTAILRTNKGQALILAYLVISVMIVLGASLLARAVSERHLAERNRLATEVFYMAEGANDNAIAAFASAIANYQIAPDAASYPVNTYFAQYGVTVTTIVRRIEDTERQVNEGQTYVSVRNYEVVSTVAHPQQPGVQVTLHQIIGRRLIPTFQHVVFYNDDLEILPGKNMTISGRIHCNEDIYMDAESGATLTIDSTSLHSAGSIYNQRKDNGSQLAGDVSIRVDKPGSPKYANMNNLDCDVDTWTADSQVRWGGSVESSVHGVDKLSAPAVASVQPAGYYANNAEVKVIDNTVYRNGVALVEGVNCPVGTVTTTTTLYNNRENTYVKTTNLDLKKLAGYTSTDPAGSPSFPNNLPSNGLLYATRDDTGFTYEPGVRLVNGTEIFKSNGLTVVSNDPVYVQGNYNTTNEKPTAIICDALNILSTTWSDSNSTKDLSSRTPATTTVNAALIAGAEDTATGHYNGGLENYPRLHENWSGTTLNIKGSFVELWESQIANGNWVYGSPQYTAPVRNWTYNTAFNNPANLPPFTPWAVEARRVAWWKD
ncbi:MAG: hypothetical protein PHN57_06935 [Candidatus Omnitrophica bacterium]|nr:hypothetical protein [Candidatus Omnitrophota bacterium]